MKDEGYPQHQDLGALLFSNRVWVFYITQGFHHEELREGAYSLSKKARESNHFADVITKVALSTQLF